MMLIRTMGRLPGMGGRFCRALTLCVIGMAAASFAIAEPCDDFYPERVALTMSDLGLGLIDVFYLSDFDPSDLGSHPVLFSFTVENRGEEPLELKLGFEVSAADGNLLRGESSAFPVLVGQTKPGTNLDLSSAGSEFKLGKLDISAAGDELEQVVLETGYLPEGDYEFRLAVMDAGGGEELSVCILTAHVSNPRTVVPIYPGALFAESLPLEGAILPLFQWESLASRFSLRLCPVLPGNLSGEEVMENLPVYEKFDFSTGFSGLHSFLYPSSAEELLPGASYCWQVEALVSTSGGEVLFPGEIFCFEIEPGASLEANDELLQTLLLLLPPGLLDDALAELQGFGSTGEASVDGLDIPTSELPLFLQSLLSQGWVPGTVEVEP